MRRACTEIARDDGQPMRGKGKQFVPHGRKVMLALPGGAGYGPVAERAVEDVRRDLARGYITQRAARETYGLTEDQIADVLGRTSRGQDV